MSLSANQPSASGNTTLLFSLKSSSGVTWRAPELNNFIEFLWVRLQEILQKMSDLLEIHFPKRLWDICFLFVGSICMVEFLISYPWAWQQYGTPTGASQSNLPNLQRSLAKNQGPFNTSPQQSWGNGLENLLVVSTHLKNISQNGNLPQIGVKIKKWLKPPPRKRPFKNVAPDWPSSPDVSWRSSIQQQGRWAPQHLASWLAHHHGMVMFNGG